MATARVPIHRSPAAAVLHIIVINTMGGSDSPGIIIGDTYQAATGNQNATATYTFGTTTGKTGGGSVKIRS